jgi:protein-L-isoaspartate(D-aspartate) O-methyltransferase
MDIEQARFNMIEQQIRPAGVLDPGVLEALLLVRREAFVPKPLQSLAFADLEIPLAHGQSMLTPTVEARILQALKLRRSDRVLEIGTGSGHMAALLASCAAKVITLECDADLAEQARGRLERAGVGNVRVETADGAEGWPGQAPFDVIVASGAVKEIPIAWREQVGPGGRILAFVGSPPVMKVQCLTRVSEDGFGEETVFEGFASGLSFANLEPFRL